MRIWLFYRAMPAKEGGSQVEFRRVQSGNVTDFLPNKLRGPVHLLSEGDELDRAIQSLVRSSGWIGEAARPANTEAAQAVLRGRW